MARRKAGHPLAEGMDNLRTIEKLPSNDPVKSREAAFIIRSLFSYNDSDEEHTDEIDDNLHLEE